ncbi:DUF262 domain-containing HNH endonuclease family protein [Mariniblastus sp.]|nr:DUF262 domain-containing HNH endonuclease family protein [Mariniblastus sp.]
MAFNIPSPSIGEVFRNHHPFYVPKYQRGYAWEEEEVTDYIKDVKNLLSQPNPEPHFMGGIVQVHIPASNIVSRTHEVVDGQQRMVTFSLTMYALSSGLKLLSNQSNDQNISGNCTAYSEEIEEAFLVFKDMQGGQRVLQPKLVLSKSDNPYFRSILEGNPIQPTRESHRLLQKAYDTIYAELVTPIIDAAMLDQDKFDKLIRIFRTVSDSCIVIHIVSPSQKEAYRLFSVMNDRGRNLTDGDLLRAFTLEETEGDPAAQNEVERRWDTILDGKSEDITKYLKAFYPSATGRRAPNKDLFDTYQSTFLTAPTSASVKEFVELFESNKPAFDAIRQAEWPFTSKSTANAWQRDRLKRLVSTLRHEAAHPLLLSAVKLGETKFIKIVCLLERFVFRYITVVGAHPSPLYKPYYDEAKKMRDHPGTYQISSLEAELATLIANRAPDISFENNLIVKLVYSDNTSRNREIRHFFSTLESYRRWYDRGATGVLTADTMIVFDVAAVTLEHIYPHNAPQASQVPAMELRKQELVNLTIMAESDNCVIGNDDFNTKKPEFANSSVGLTKRLALFPQWTPTELDIRKNELLQMALAVFSFQ